MANEEQLSILKQGVKVWNEWRENNKNVEIDLSDIDLSGVNLQEVNFNNVDLSRGNFVKADLRSAEFVEAYLQDTQLKEANLAGAEFNAAVLFRADLSQANLTEADFSGADLIEANLIGADLSAAEFWNIDLNRSNFSKAVMWYTSFDGADVSDVIGLDDAVHKAPSSISRDTFARSKGRIPDVFLRGCGLSDWEIELVKLYDPDLSNGEIANIQYKMYDLRATQALQISPLFISYSHADSQFIDKIGNTLTEKGVRYWRDIHDMQAGRIEKQIDRAISQNRTVLLVLSEHSLSSDWVEHEVRMARGLEKEMGRDVLCPVALDDSWKSSRWPKRIMEQITEYNILDFSEWKDDTKFGDMFRKLIDGLELFYKGEAYGE